jgi:hypothetical protein
MEIVTGGGVDPRDGLDAVVKRKIPDHPARSPSLYHWAIPAHNNKNKKNKNKNKNKNAYCALRPLQIQNDSKYELRMWLSSNDWAVSKRLPTRDSKTD